jgi:hypothetical protein
MEKANRPRPVHSSAIAINQKLDPQAEVRSPMAGRPAESGWIRAGRQVIGFLMIPLVSLAITGCDFRRRALEELLRQGHAATMDCLQGERARSDGDEIRCQDWRFVEMHYLRAEGREKAARR